MTRASLPSPLAPRPPPLRRRLGIIGCGNMGEALLKGLLRASVIDRRRVRVAELDAARGRRIRRTYRIEVGRGAAAVAAGSDVVLLAVKPQQLADVAAEIAPAIGVRTGIISILAGVPTRRLEALFGRRSVVRVMPNLPCLVGAGMSVLAPGRYCAARDRDAARLIFGTVGEVVELRERWVDCVTAVSGSGPAYVAYVLAALRDAGCGLGLPAAVASRLVAQTVRGTMALLDDGAMTPEAVIERVASKGGTTEAALAVLAARGGTALWREAVGAAFRRAQALGR